MFRISLEDFNIQKIAESGQCFRMNKIKSEGVYERWQLLACNKLAYIMKEPFGNGCIVECSDEDNIFWMYYFDLETDYARYRHSVDPQDPFLSAAVEYGKGIRILRQNPWEMLITFIISQRRSIPSIKTCVERICSRYGDEIEPGIYAFPTAAQLSSASIEELEECGLGYRAEYVFLAARRVSSGEADLLLYDSLSDDKLFEKLLEFRGVGPKVANCVSLFGYYRISAFPVDVWIDRVQKTYYMGRFPVELYDGYAGIMQQFIFYFARTK